MRIWRQRGEHQQAIGRSRGGRTTKIHALTDAECRPVAFLLTGGQIADCTAGAVLLEEMPRSAILHGDKGYDSDAIRRQVEGKGAMPNIPPKANRRWKNCFSPVLYHIFPKKVLKGSYTSREADDISNLAFIGGKTNRQI